MEALGLLEVGSVATGLATVDALTKRARVTIRGAGVVEPGRFVLLFAGDLGDVDEAWDEALRRADGQVLDRIRIANVHPRVWDGLAGVRRVGEPECVGVIEGTSIAGTLEACDRALKDADVDLAGLRLTPGLGGRAYFAVSGLQHDVEAAIDAAIGALGSRVHRTERIARPTAELLAALLAPGAFTVA